jgi:hypothetical protein
MHTSVFANPPAETAERLFKVLRPVLPKHAEISMLPNAGALTCRMRIEWDEHPINLTIPATVIADYQENHPLQRKDIETKLAAFLREQVRAYKPTRAVTNWSFTR